MVHKLGNMRLPLFFQFSCDFSTSAFLSFPKTLQVIMSLVAWKLNEGGCDVSFDISRKREIVFLHN